MSRRLAVAIGQCSDRGVKEQNQDFHGALVPTDHALASKGVVVALADGISSSDVSHIAAESAVKALMTDYFCTSDAWSVKTSAQRVIAATNSWLHGQSMRDRRGADRDRGYVCTLSALVLKSATAHIFHVGDCRIWRVAGARLEQLTEDHRVFLSSQESYLGRALGVNRQVEIDYRALPIASGDVFVLTSDGVHDFLDDATLIAAIRNDSADLDRAAVSIVAAAMKRGSDDNLTVQIVRIDDVPNESAQEAGRLAGELPLPPVLEPRALFDGFRIVRELRASSRSHVYLATDEATGERVVVKTPSVDMVADAALMRRFLMEEWVARRIDSAHVLKVHAPERPRAFLYVVTEYVEGQTLAQWMRDNPKPSLETVRRLIEQIAAGLRAMHRREMVHQDLRPENVMIDTAGTTKIIDFGSTRVAGVAEGDPNDAPEILGTAQYTAPEYFLGETGDARADVFSLGVIAYQMLSGRLPYGVEVSRRRTRAAQRRLRYAPVGGDDSELPPWIDAALEKALKIDPVARYDEVAQFCEDLRKPGAAFEAYAPRSLLDRNPLLFWKGLSLALAIVVVVLLWRAR